MTCAAGEALTRNSSQKLRYAPATPPIAPRRSIDVQEQATGYRPQLRDNTMTASVDVTCGDCGMPCASDEYHPYAACLMFKACHNTTIVRANLEAALASRRVVVGEAMVERALRAQIGRAHDGTT